MTWSLAPTSLTPPHESSRPPCPRAEACQPTQEVSPEVSSTENTSQVIADLKAARAELVARGRSTGDLVRADGSVCAVGAIAVAVTDKFEPRFMAWMQAGCPPDAHAEWVLPYLSPRVSAAKRALAAHVPDGYVQGFNDDVGTTDADVLNLYDKTLADLGGLGDE